MFLPDLQSLYISLQTNLVNLTSDILKKQLEGNSSMTDDLTPALTSSIANGG